MKSKSEQYDWLEDAFDEEKDAQLEEELRRARAKSRATMIVLLAVIAVLVLVGGALCSAASLLGAGIAS